MSKCDLGYNLLILLSERKLPEWIECLLTFRPFALQSIWLHFLSTHRQVQLTCEKWSQILFLTNFRGLTFEKKCLLLVCWWKKNLSNCKRMPHLLLLALSSVTEVKNTAKVTKCLPRCLPAPPPHAAAGVACVLPKPTTWPAPRRGAGVAAGAAY